MDSGAVAVNPFTHDSDTAWNRLKATQTVRAVTPLPLDTPVKDDAVRFVCISDTHSAIERMRYPIPDGDVLLHAGDFTKRGLAEEVDAFSRFLATLPHRHKFVIAGNHELSFDPATTGYSQSRARAALEEACCNGHGTTTDGETVFVNAAICDVRYRPVNEPIIFDVPLPAGVSKDHH
ncbi:hypothetical protein HPB51_002719 [Rhipicephalus microplus]|uniref:Calcineurin-like phosphoesterase domain-containing protein n=1 Tax=Rhipicephalus microplus TaxID=6941 RepID=A0A9J6E6F0_RHIMP|nr:hypothetical protein HPB51_002719 [Rhipicephalus microplus]